MTQILPTVTASEIMADITIIAFTKRGAQLGLRLAEHFDAPLAVAEKYADELGCKAYVSLSDWTQEAWKSGKSLVFIGASGIGVRAIAPLVRDKFSDPAVVSIDEMAEIAVPLLSGHVGGANELALEIADFVAGRAAVSTATDINGLVAIDVWARRRELAISDRAFAKEVSARLLDGEEIAIISDYPIRGKMPKGMAETGSQKVYITHKSEPTNALRLIPKSLNIGIGCRRGKTLCEIEDAVFEVLTQHNIDIRAIKTLCSIDIKKDEAGLIAFAQKYALAFITYTADELMAQEGDFTPSKFVSSITGADNVCERSAVLCGGELITRKFAKNGVTVAISNSGCSYEY